MTLPLTAASPVAAPPAAPQAFRTREGSNQEPIPSHSGAPMPGLDLFAPPPAAIGRILSAQSNLRADKKWLTQSQRLALIAAVGGGVALVVYGLACALRGDVSVVGLFPAASMGTVAGLVARALVSPKSTATYVGEAGVARFTRDGGPWAPVVADVALFQNLQSLKVEQTRNLVNGSYSSTKFTFWWWAKPGQLGFSVMGTHWTEVGSPSADSDFHFGLAAEAAWTRFLLGWAQGEVARAGAITFPHVLGPVVVGPGFVDFTQAGGGRWPGSELALTLGVPGTINLTPVRSATPLPAWRAVRADMPNVSFFEQILQIVGGVHPLRSPPPRVG